MTLLSAEAVVANTIRLTELLLTKNQVSWNDARDGIEFIKQDLASKRPADSAMIKARFDAWIRAQDSRSAQILPFQPRARDAHSTASDIDQTKVNGAHASLRLGRGA
jgi:hypothetical protein